MRDRRVFGVQRLQNRLFDRLRCRYVGITQRKIQNILSTDHRGTLIAKLKQLADGRTLLAKRNYRFIEHIYHDLPQMSM